MLAVARRHDVPRRAAEPQRARRELVVDAQVMDERHDVLGVELLERPTVILTEAADHLAVRQARVGL